MILARGTGNGGAGGATYDFPVRLLDSTDCDQAIGRKRGICSYAAKRGGGEGRGKGSLSREGGADGRSLITSGPRMRDEIQRTHRFTDSADSRFTHVHDTDPAAGISQAASAFDQSPPPLMLRHAIGVTKYSKG